MMDLPAFELQTKRSKHQVLLVRESCVARQLLVTCPGKGGFT
jgi:hypothetical protein